MPRFRSPWIDRLEYLGVRAPVAAIRCLPFEKAFRLGAPLGTLAFHAARPQRAAALTNLAIAFPERSPDEHLAILRDTYRNLGRMVIEFCHMDRLTPENVNEVIPFEDPALWASCKEVLREKSMIVLTAHFGNWELFAQAMGLHGTPGHLFYRPFRNPHFDRFVERSRARTGTTLIPRRGAVREVIRIVRRPGALVAVPFDQNATGRWGVFADLFGVPASTHPGVVKLAKLARVPVLPAFVVRNGTSATHRITIGEPIELASTGDVERDTADTLTRCNHALEAAIREHPDHWIWMHKRWRTRPPGTPPLYGDAG